MKIACILALALAASAQQPKSADNCAPPPSSLAPTLPAHILPGMGTVHLAITTSSPEAQQFFDQGVAQMHSFWAREAERSRERYQEDPQYREQVKAKTRNYEQRPAVRERRRLYKQAWYQRRKQAVSDHAAEPSAEGVR